MMLRCLLAGVLALCLATWVQAQDAPPSLATNEQVAAWEGVANRAETAAETGQTSTFALGRLRTELFDWREAFSDDLNLNAGRLATIDAQLQALGQPAEGEDEPQELADRRAALEAERARLQVPAVFAAEAHARADGLINEVDALIRDREAVALRERTPSPLNPVHWPEALAAFSAGIGSLVTNLASRAGAEVLGGTVVPRLPLGLLYIVVAVVLLLRGRSFASDLHARTAEGATRWRALLAFAVSLGKIALPTVGLISAMMALTHFRLFTGPDADIIPAIFAGGFTIIFAHWLIDELLPVTFAGPLGYDPDTRSAIRKTGLALSIVIAASLLIEAITRLGDPSVVGLAVVMAPTTLLNVWLLFRLGRLLRTAPTGSVGPTSSEGRVRSFLGFAVMVIAVATLVLWMLGYNAAANAISVPATLTLALFGTVIVLQSLVMAIFAPAEELAEDDAGPLLPVLIGFALFLIAIPPLALVWGAKWSDLLEVWTRFSEGISLGEARLSPGDFLTFLIVFAVAYLITRFVQSTLKRSVLPRTRLDIGAQNAVVSGVGYVGIFISAIAAITAAGIDLSSIALVAGALSVGIGFGLQNIVQNFVSGIILLIERPIGEGDMIEVNGQMGYVRDISVRSTRIETFDRTDVIIPNADLVSGQVTNWTHGNAIGRLILPVGVAYGTDVEKVRTILMEVARNHPMVLLDPEPAVLFTAFGASSLDFEIRVILRDVNWKLVVASEMNQEINARFAAAGIEIPFAQRDLWLRNPEALRDTGKGEADT